MTGGGIQHHYGFPQREMPADADFYTLSNEDIGLIASLVINVNEVFLFALPYPNSIDLDEETIRVERIDFMYQDIAHVSTANNIQGLVAFVSMLEKQFGPTWRGLLVDAEDEAFKAQFGGPFYFGRSESTQLLIAVAGSHNAAAQPSVAHAIYTPPYAIDLLTPLYIQLLNQSVSRAVTTGAILDIDFSTFERVSLRVWFTRRTLTSEERSARKTGLRLMMLDS